MKNAIKRFETRKMRVRTAIKKNVKNNIDKLRLTVFRSGRHVYAQVINDEKGITLASASTLDKTIRETNKSQSNISNAEKVGFLLGKRASEKGVSKVVFDKGGYKYHGVVKALADKAREYLKF
ncbi:MAG: 50S ribosomal protein L18 [Rickettsiaceae bacterium]|nr:50S ribosomal protein L18 [Rickettsiaceae bacterium]